MDLGFPVVMLGLPPIAALIALLLRRWRRVTVIVGVASVLLLTLLLWIAAPAGGLFSDNSFVVYGHELVLTAPIRSLFLFIYPALGLLSTLHWFRPQGRMLIPSGLAALSPLSAALMISPPALGMFLLLIAVAVVLPALYGGQYRTAVAVWRYFLMIALGLAPLLVAGWFQAGGLGQPWVAPLLATLLLLGGFPFHVWIVGLARRSPPAAVALVLGLVHIVVVVYVLSILDASPAARAATEFQAAVRWSATLTAVLAAFRMSRAADWRELAAGALLLDSGFLLAATLAPGASGAVLALPALVSRYLAAILLAIGLRWPAHSNTRGAEGRLPSVRLLRLVLVVYACLTLIGLPLTAGFSGRWAQLSLIAAPPTGSGGWPAILLLASLGWAIWSVVRAAAYPQEPPEPAVEPQLGEQVLGLVLLAASLILGLFPDLLVGAAARLVGTF